MSEFKEKFKAMYAEVWKIMSPYLWEEDKFTDDKWKEVVDKANKAAENEPTDDATDLSLCLLKAIERRQKIL